MQDGSFEELEIIELKIYDILEFMWSGEDSVRFELYQESGGCKLVLKEKIEVLTDHTPKDLAGWHVCLDVINGLMDGKTIDSREEDWKEWNKKYILAVKKVSENDK